jgi:hypothetical protein
MTDICGKSSQIERSISLRLHKIILFRGNCNLISIIKKCIEYKIIDE